MFTLEYDYATGLFYAEHEDGRILVFDEQHLDEVIWDMIEE